MEDQVEIKFIEIISKASEQALDLAKKVYEKVSYQERTEEDYHKEKLIIDISNEIFQSSLTIVGETFDGLKEAFFGYSKSKCAQDIKDIVQEDFYNVRSILKDVKEK